MRSPRWKSIRRVRLRLPTVEIVAVAAVATAAASLVPWIWPDPAAHALVSALAGVTFLAALLLWRSMIRLGREVREMRAGDIERRITGFGHGGRLGRLAADINGVADLFEAVLRDICLSLDAVVRGRSWRRVVVWGLDGMLRAWGAWANHLLQQADERRRQFIGVGDVFEREVAGHVAEVRDIAQRLRLAAQQVGTASAEVARDMEATAAAVTELAASVEEIARNSAQEAEAVAACTADSERASATAHSCRETTTRIADIVETIRGFAEETHLLALNATIEAARAGESGKGFAVVAREIKALAERSREASEEIADHLEGVRRAVAEVDTIVATLTDRMRQVEGSAGATRTAVEQQHATVRELDEIAQRVAAAVRAVARRFGQDAEGETGVARLAEDVTRRIVELERACHGFLEAARCERGAGETREPRPQPPAQAAVGG